MCVYFYIHNENMLIMDMINLIQNKSLFVYIYIYI